MFRFNNYYPKLCNTLPNCGTDCHDLNECFNNATFIDKSGESHYIFSTFDDEWELTCLSGTACNQEVYDKPPKYHRHYAPCCWEIELTGGSGEGLCGQSCEQNFSYSVSSPSFNVVVSEDNTTADVYINHFLYGHGTGGCNTPNEPYPFYSGSLLLGTITDFNCGLDGRNISGTMGFVQASSVPSLCNYDDVEATYTGKYSRQECGGSLFINTDFGLDWQDCLDVSTIIESGFPGCYTQDGEFISLGDPYSNEYEVSVYSALNFALSNFVVGGVVGHDDDVPLESAIQTSCLHCLDLNRTWVPGDWNGQIPYSPASTCCKCPETDMCLNNWDIDLFQPSSIITLNSYGHGPVAKWTKVFPASGCVIDDGGGSWDFENTWQAIPESGDFPVESGFWNRCDFSNSSIGVNYSTDFIPTVVNSGIDCQEEIATHPNGHCNACIDSNGPESFLVTVDLDIKKVPVYRTEYVPFDPPVYEPNVYCDDAGEYLEKYYSKETTDIVGYTEPSCKKFQEHIRSYNSRGIPDNCWVSYSSRKYCYPYFDISTGIDWVDNRCLEEICYTDVIGVEDCDCSMEEMNGAWVVERPKSSCRSEVTQRDGDIQCNCTPCSSGLLSQNSCSWRVNTVCGLSDPNKSFNLGTGKPGSSGQCPCGFSNVIDANGVLITISPQKRLCAGCPSGEVTLIQTIYQNYAHDYVFGYMGINCWNDTEVYNTLPGEDCPCCPEGPTVIMYPDPENGKIIVGVRVRWNKSCDYYYGKEFDAPVSGFVTGYDCNGDPYTTDYVDCNIPISFSFAVPSGICTNGGTITVESI